MLTRLACLLALLIARADERPSPVASADPGDLTVHEWGTFTTVAGQDGFAIDWLPLGGPTDLPCFVEHFQDRRDAKIALNQPTPVDYATARANLWGRVRMETPVLYFYTSRPTTVSVRVQFPHGLMTEWYPRASVAQPFVNRDSYRSARWASWIAWPNVAISPGASPRFPAGEGESHYYVARNTDAAPLTVNGQSERFLFYRGVGSFEVPISTVAVGDTAVRISTLDRDELQGAVLFSNRHGVVGYRVLGTLPNDTVVAAPNRGGTLAELRREIERMLVRGGLYQREATAMVDSWRDSWFEEGTRVLYLVPPRHVDQILPLTITPAPKVVARVFVGRMEVITPATEQSVARAIANHDGSELERYGRFLGPIADRILASNSTGVDRQRIDDVTRTAFTSYLRRVSSCD